MISLHKWGGGYKAISSIMSTCTEVKVSQQRNTDQIRTLSALPFFWKSQWLSQTHNVSVYQVPINSLMCSHNLSSDGQEWRFWYKQVWPSTLALPGLSSESPWTYKFKFSKAQFPNLQNANNTSTESIMRLLWGESEIIKVTSGLP